MVNKDDKVHTPAKDSRREKNLEIVCLGGSLRYGIAEK